MIVTLHVSVWVEMKIFSIIQQKKASRSTWACELKFVTISRTNVWAGHAPRERVSWNNDGEEVKARFVKGHAPRERVSWNDTVGLKRGDNNGHAPRERVSWNAWYVMQIQEWQVTLHVSVWVEMNIIPLKTIPWQSHAPRERVSWNQNLYQCKAIYVVTLHVSVWVEISFSFIWLTPVLVTLHVSVWVEIPEAIGAIAAQLTSRSTWACELKWQVCKRASEVV